MVNYFFKRIIFIKENTFISSGNTYCDVILNVDHLGFGIRQLFAHDLAPLSIHLPNLLSIALECPSEKRTKSLKLPGLCHWTSPAMILH